MRLWPDGWCENVLAWRRYGRLSSFHTVLSKIAGVLLSVYIGALFLFGHWDALLWLAAVASLLASAEELWLLALLPDWRADVKGVWWLWRKAGTPEQGARGGPTGHESRPSAFAVKPSRR